MHKHQALLWMCAGFLGGVFLGSVYQGLTEYTWFLLSISLAGLVCYLSGILLPSILGRKLLTVVFALMGLSVGIWQITSQLAIPNGYMDWIGQKQDFEGVIVQEPDKRPDKQLLTVQADGKSQNILVTVSPYRRYRYGDRVWIRGKVVSAKEFDGFDYPGFLAKGNIYALMRYPKVIVLKAGEGKFVYEKIYSLKKVISDRIEMYYPKPASSLLLGLLIGERRSLPESIKEQFVRTGTSHIMAVSGFNIAIFIAGLSGLAFFLGRRITLVLSIVLIAIFVILVGPSGSVLRAAGMGYAVLAALNLGRLYTPLPVMLLVASFMVLLNPRILYWDVGFILSLSATLGIVLVYPVLKNRLDTKVKALVYGPLAITLTATVFTLPITLWQFGQLSQVGPVANVLISPVIPVAMAFGGLSLFPLVGPGFAFINSLLLKYILRVVEVFSSISWAVLDFELPGRIALLLLVVLGVGLYYFQKKYLERRLA